MKDNDLSKIIADIIIGITGPICNFFKDIFQMFFNYKHAELEEKRKRLLIICISIIIIVSIICSFLYFYKFS